MLLIFTLIILGFGLFIFLVVIPLLTKQGLKDIYERMKPGDIWIDKRNGTNPFDVYKVKILKKRMGTDGETPWVMYERPSGFRDTMSLKDFIKLYSLDTNKD